MSEIRTAAQMNKVWQGVCATSSFRLESMQQRPPSGPQMALRTHHVIKAEVFGYEGQRGCQQILIRVQQRRNEAEHCHRIISAAPLFVNVTPHVTRDRI